MAIFARAATASGADVPGLLLGRFAIAGAVLAAVMGVAGRAFPRGRPLAVAAAMGAVGYVLQSVCYFAALNHASAGLVALLLYAYPTIVCLLAAAFLGERLTPRRAALLAAGFGGIALMLGGGSGSLTGIALGLGAALVYSVYILVGARELGRSDALGVSTVVCLSAAATLALTAPFTAPSFPRDGSGWLAVAAIAACSVVAILSFFAGLARVGPSRASIVSTLEPVVTVVLAWAFLGETLGAWQLLGGAVVLGVAVLLAVSDAGANRGTPISANGPPISANEAE